MLLSLTGVASLCQDTEWELRAPEPCSAKGALHSMRASSCPGGSRAHPDVGASASGLYGSVPLGGLRKTKEVSESRPAGPGSTSH